MTKKLPLVAKLQSALEHYDTTPTEIEKLLSEVSNLVAERDAYRLWVEKWLGVRGQVQITKGMVEEEVELLGIYLKHPEKTT